MSRNQWHFCTPTMNYQKEKLEKNKFTIAITTTKKVFRNNLTKEVKDLYLEHYRTLEETN